MSKYYDVGTTLPIFKEERNDYEKDFIKIGNYFAYTDYQSILKNPVIIVSKEMGYADREQYEELIIQWAKDRKIIPNATLHAQFLKFIEESGEIIADIREGNPVEDSIGDTAVTLILLYQLLQKDSKEPRYLYNSQKIFDGEHNPVLLDERAFFTSLSFYSGKLAGAIAKNYTKKAIIAVEMLYELLRRFAVETTISGCLGTSMKIAYEEIKNRKGTLTKEGVFIKEGD